MSEDYWGMQIDRLNEAVYKVPAVAVRAPEPKNLLNDPAEYIQMQLPDGEAVRFKRVWSGHRFTDGEVARLMAGMEIRIETEHLRGVIGSLEWQNYNSRDYYGFSPWAMEAYSRENAPFPKVWNNHRFTEEEEAVLRAGHKVLLVCVSNRSGSTYAVHVSFMQVTGKDGEERWGINPYFDEFSQPASSFTRETCPFKPVFSGKTLTQAEIAHVRAGGSIPFSGISKAGRPYTCQLVLKIDTRYGERWCLSPVFG